MPISVRKIKINTSELCSRSSFNRRYGSKAKLWTLEGAFTDKRTC